MYNQFDLFVIIKDLVLYIYWRVTTYQTARHTYGVLCSTYFGQHGRQTNRSNTGRPRGHPAPELLDEWDKRCGGCEDDGC